MSDEQNDDVIQARAFRALIGAAWATINHLPRTPPEQIMHSTLMIMAQSANKAEAIKTMTDAITKHFEGN